MPDRSSKARLDLNQLAARIVEETTNEAPRDERPQKDPAAVSLGQRGGQKGGPARAAKLTPERRREIAKKAAAIRWAESASHEPTSTPQ